MCSHCYESETHTWESQVVNHDIWTYILLYLILISISLPILLHHYITSVFFVSFSLKMYTHTHGFTKHFPIEESKATKRTGQNDRNALEGFVAGDESQNWNHCMLSQCLVLSPTTHRLHLFSIVSHIKFDWSFCFFILFYFHQLFKTIPKLAPSLKIHQYKYTAPTC